MIGGFVPVRARFVLMFSALAFVAGGSLVAGVLVGSRPVRVERVRVPVADLDASLGALGSPVASGVPSEDLGSLGAGAACDVFVDKGRALVVVRCVPK